MQHIMIDAYKLVKPEEMDNLRSMYDNIVKLCYDLKLKNVMPPILVPYYYGSVKEDDGISAYVILSGGHFTIHAFPQRECYFADIFLEDFISEENCKSVLKKYFPYEKDRFNAVDRRFDIEQQMMDENTINAESDFGPHYLMETTDDVILDIDKIYHLLDTLPKRINMDPIMRPYVITDTVDNWKYISGIVVIAQSHIAIHYDVEEKKAYLDIFSCSFLKGDNFATEIEKELGVKLKSTLISRGTKHTNKIPFREDMIEKYKIWEKNIEG